MSTPTDDLLLNLPPLKRQPRDGESDALVRLILHWTLEFDEAVALGNLIAAGKAKSELHASIAHFRTWQRSWHAEACTCWSCASPQAGEEQKK